MTSNLDMNRFAAQNKSPQIAAGEDAKALDSEKHLEHVDVVQGDLAYEDAEHEPELHMRTWIALAAMCLLNYNVVFALLSPPAVVSDSPSDLNTAVLIFFADLIYRDKPRRHDYPNLGAERTYTAPGNPGPLIFLGIGCFPGPQGAYGLYDRHLFHWFRHCTWLTEHIPAHRRPDPDIVRILGRSSGLRDSQ